MTPRVALVTGAGKRVGQAIALRLARDGHHVAVHFHASRDGADETVARIRDTGGVAQAFGADLSDGAAAPDLIAAVVAHFAGLDVLVNSAASWLRAPLGSVTAQQFDLSVATNLRAPFLLAQAAAPHLAARHGAIVNIADHLAYDWASPYLAHGVVKGAVEHLTRGLARVLAPAVRVNAVAPGVVLLPDATAAAVEATLVAETPLARLGTPDDVADAVAWLANAGYVTGEVLHVDGGRHLGR
jgi:pteridine reductase